MDRKLLLRLGMAALIAGAIVLIVSWTNRGPKRVAELAGSPVPSPLPGFVVLAGQTGDVAAATDEQREAYLEKTYQTYRHYLEFSAYPPWSRPADGSQQHLIDWNPPIGHALPMGTDGEGTIHGEAALDKMFAAAGETLTVTARAWREDAQGKREPVEFDVTGEVRIWDENEAHAYEGKQPPVGVEPGWVVAAPLAFSANSASFVPSTIEALGKRLQDAEVVAWISAGQRRIPFSLQFRYAKVAPFQVIAGKTDTLASGSLDVTLLVDVQTPTPVLVQAALFGDDGTVPVAIYDGFFRPQRRGPQEMTVTFFGKAIRDSGVDGPYTVRALHGNVQVEPFREVFWSYGGSVTTKRYRAADFSDAEWQSPERDAKAQQYEAFIQGIKEGKN